LVALTTAASRWRDRVPFVPFAAPLCSLFPRRVTCAPFENSSFISLNPFFFLCLFDSLNSEGGLVVH
jgi:hypothetical protein